MSKLIVTLFGVGYLNPAPGTWGSLISLPLFWLIYEIFGLIGSILIVVVLFLSGWNAIKIYSNQTQTHDSSEIVIDEVVGQFIALLPIAFDSYFAQTQILHLWPFWISAFLIFRIMDILKPGVIGRIDKVQSAFYVMLDDVLAGFFAAFIVCLLIGIIHAII